ncbi:hypothetical protein NSA47_08205 [Irregularibacter muris]|uniref:Lipoprotein n=1 Tax=Irregularibacter muris TaxID=1796619 RepID=A0AAE3KZC0_9FIRM|nr:hypothetical protein [Irregularibacter muris]MCR1898965.1 hypothetical protein [Irregularibacter muris]
MRKLRKKILVISALFIVLLLTGCNNEVAYSENFEGIPIYPGMQLLEMLDSEEMVSEKYIDFDFKGNLDKVKTYFHKNINQEIWEIVEAKEVVHNSTIDKQYNYQLENDNEKASVMFIKGKDKTLIIDLIKGK